MGWSGPHEVVIADNEDEDEDELAVTSCWFCCSNPRINGSDLRPVTLEIVC